MSVISKAIMCLPRQEKLKDLSQTKIRVGSTIMFILVGCIVFVTIPAVIFKSIEGWTTLEAIYFVVITLTTVGIGDYVAGTLAVFLSDYNDGDERRGGGGCGGELTSFAALPPGSHFSYSPSPPPSTSVPCRWKQED